MLRHIFRRSPFGIRSLSTTSSSVIDSLTPDLRKDITGSDPMLKFRIESLKSDLFLLESMRFPLPTKLSPSEWTDLVEFKTLRARFAYLNSEDVDLKKLDALWDPEYLTYDEEELKDILSPEEDKKFRLMVLYRDSLREDGERVPCKISKEQIISALKRNPGSRSLKNYLDFLAKKEFHHINTIIKKRVKVIEAPKVKAEHNKKKEDDIKSGKISYGLGGNSIFLRIIDSTMDRDLNWKVIREFDPVEGSPIVIDLSFLKTLHEKDARSFIHQELIYALCWNRNAPSPYAIYITEFDPCCSFCIHFKAKFPRLFDPDSPVFITEKSYLDLFPQERLLYLSPDSKNDLTTYKGDDIYIIGGIVDPSGNTPHTLGKAKKQRIRHARLPMKRVVGLSAQLNVDHMVAIMCEWKNSRDWLSAFRFIPTRFFGNRIKSQGNVSFSTATQMKAIHEAFRALSPKSTDEVLISATKYREKLNKLLADEGISTDNLLPWKTFSMPDDANKKFNYVNYVKDKNYKNSNFSKRNHRLNLEILKSESSSTHK